jgi:hypothetical protein
MYLVEVGRPADDAYKNMVAAACCEETLGQVVYMFFFSMAWCDIKGVKLRGALVGNFFYF